MICMLAGFLANHDRAHSQGTHRQGDYKTMQVKLTTQGKRGKKVTKWSVQILESGVGREGFVEVPVTLWKKVPEEVSCGRKGLRFKSERREVVQRRVGRG